MLFPRAILSPIPTPLLRPNLGRLSAAAAECTCAREEWPGALGLSRPGVLDPSGAESAGQPAARAGRQQGVMTSPRRQPSHGVEEPPDRDQRGRAAKPARAGRTDRRAR
jgi:hypothetical protein